MLVDDGDVPRVGFPDHVEKIAEQWDDAEFGFDGYIHQHPDDLGAWQAEPRGFIDDVE